MRFDHYLQRYGFILMMVTLPRETLLISETIPITVIINNLNGGYPITDIQVRIRDDLTAGSEIRSSEEKLTARKRFPGYVAPYERKVVQLPYRLTWHNIQGRTLSGGASETITQVYTLYVRVHVPWPSANPEIGIPINILDLPIPSTNTARNYNTNNIAVLDDTDIYSYNNIYESDPEEFQELCSSPTLTLRADITASPPGSDITVVPPPLMIV